MRLSVLRIGLSRVVVQTVGFRSQNGNIVIWSIYVFLYIERENTMSRRTPTTEYNADPEPSISYPVIMEGDPVHLPPYYFCATNDPTCPCRDDQDLIAHVNQEYQVGLLTSDEASRIVQGRQINS